jgi:hypothetical protein
LKNQSNAIAVHCGIDPSDVRIVKMNHGGDLEVLRHFVAVDHNSKSVVLALRGTLSISGALIDIEAMDTDFCYGKAHKGMAEMADTVWKESGKEIVKLFQKVELKDYSFTITGHSLGAGTACLLNVKCHVEQLLGDRTVRCFGFAPPPTYSYDASKMHPTVRTAIDNSLCYIHDNDCVPFLLVRSVARRLALMDTVDNRTERMWAFQRFKIFWDWEPIPNVIVNDVKLVDKHGASNGAGQTVEGASKLEIPLVFWMKKNSAGTFETYGCNPSKVAELNIFCWPDMLTDHMPEQYEDALDAVKKLLPK